MGFEGGLIIFTVSLIAAYLKIDFLNTFF
ncbi:hypothetical protein [Bartonella bacilliformis]